VNRKLKLARVAKDLSQQELADLVFNPSLSLCLRLARALDRTLDELFWEEEVDHESTQSASG
jgi:putative transcriptional regulator